MNKKLEKRLKVWVFWFIVLFAVSILWEVFGWRYTLSKLNKSISEAETDILQAHQEYQKVKEEWEEKIIQIEDKYKKLRDTEVGEEVKKIDNAKVLWQTANAKLNALYAEKQRLIGGARTDIVVPIYQSLNPDRGYLPENMDKLFSWIKEKEGRPYKLGAKGWEEWFDCSGLFSTFSHYNGGITRDDMIYRMSAHHIYALGTGVTVENLQKGDFVYWTKPAKMYMQHIAIVVEPLKDGKIVIFDASPEYGVSNRSITVSSDNNGVYTSIWSDNTYKLVGTTNFFLSVPLTGDTKTEVGKQ